MLRGWYQNSTLNHRLKLLIRKKLLLWNNLIYCLMHTVLPLRSPMFLALLFGFFYQTMICLMLSLLFMFLQRLNIRLVTCSFIQRFSREYFSWLYRSVRHNDILTLQVLKIFCFLFTLVARNESDVVIRVVAHHCLVVFCGVPITEVHEVFMLIFFVDILSRFHILKK